MRAALSVISSVFRDMTSYSLVDAYLRSMLPPSQAQTKYLRLLWWGRIKDHYVLCGNLGYECVFKRVIIGAILSKISQFDAFQLQFWIIFAFTLQCFSNQKRFFYVFRMFTVHAIFLGHRFFFIPIGLSSH